MHGGTNTKQKLVMSSFKTTIQPSVDCYLYVLNKTSLKINQGLDKLDTLDILYMKGESKPES